MSFKIGPYQLSSPVLLAPMAGTSDKPFRKICRHFGAGLATSEMVIMQDHLLKTNKSKYRLDFSGEDSPISIQIAGSEPEEIANYAQQAVNFGAEIVDINMGCPAKKVCNKDSGSALMKDESLVCEILKKTVNSISVPVTLKMRTGWDEDNKNALSIAKMAEDIGVQMIAIHGRTRIDKFSGDAEYYTAYEVASSVSIPVIANGDIVDKFQAKQILNETPISGVMIGRAAQGNPWVFKEISEYIKDIENKNLIDTSYKIKTILEHISSIHNFYGEELGVILARKHIFWYSKSLDPSGYQNFWSKINKLKNHKEQYKVLEEYLNLYGRKVKNKT